MPLPVGKPGAPPQKIHLPKIRETMTPGVTNTVAPPITSPFPSIRLPTAQTVMQPVALPSPRNVPQQQETGIAVAYTPQQQVVENIMQVDPTRLNPDRAKKGDNSYTVAQLRGIAGSLDLPKSGNKKELVERITAKILKVNPNAFNK